MGDVFLHLGMQKTGTTWIQEELFARMNVVLFRRWDVVDYIPKDKKVIISMEWLCGTSYTGMPYQNRFDIAKRLKGMFPNARVILGIRDKEGWVRSTYSQYVKNGGILSFSHWRGSMFNESYLDYLDYILYLRNLFNDVFIYTFKDLKGDKHVFAKRLCGFVGEPVPDYVDRVYNKRFSENKLFMLRQMNKLFHSELNSGGLLPGTFGHFFRFFVKKVSGSWQ